MTTTPNMGMALPTVGGSSGAWGTLLNDALLNKVDLHDHSNGLGVQITPSGLNINADLTFAGNGLTNLGKAAFTAVTALASGSKTLFVSSADNELYWRTQSGSNVKLTNGASLNVSAFVGGIGGDYSAVSAALNYDNADTRYTFKQAGGTTWARIASGELRVYETGTSETFYVGIAAPAALAGSYTITLPTAAPGSTQLMQMSSAGVVSASNTIANAVTCSALITASAGVTCGANQHVTVSGTGEFKHGDRVLAFGGSSGVATNANITRSTTENALTSTGATTMLFSIPLHVGDRIKSVVFAVKGDGAADISTIDIKKVAADGTGTSLSPSTTSVTNPAAAYADTTCTVTNTTLASGEQFYMLITISAANIEINNVRVTYDRP